VFGSHEKITKDENQSQATVAGIRQRLLAVAGFQRGQVLGGQILPNSDAS
jgi:hypothetical protein